MNSRFSIALAAVVAALFSGSPSHADDRPLIWQPAKNSDTSYSVKLGLKLPTELEPEAGFDVGVNTSTGGAIVETPLKFWTSLKAGSIQRPAYEMSRDIGLDVDHTAGAAAITMNYYEKHIATSSIDIERQSSYAVRYDTTTQAWAGIDVSQSVRVSSTASGTAVIVRANSSDNFKAAGAGVALEQNFGSRMSVSGAIDQASYSAAPVASVNARYAFKW
jgi:hypothetical protein